MDYEKIQDAIRSVLVAIGEDPHREGLADTPRRIAEMYGELFSGIGIDPASVLTTGFDEGYDETVILRDVPFHSICEHHFLPFFGTAHIAYVPTGRVAGASNGARPRHPRKQTADSGAPHKPARRHPLRHAATDRRRGRHERRAHVHVHTWRAQAGQQNSYHRSPEEA